MTKNRFFSAEKDRKHSAYFKTFGPEQTKDISVQLSFQVHSCLQ